MEKNTEVAKAEWMSVPAFGEWEKQQGMLPDYSLDFSKIRQMRKQNKSDFTSLSVGNDAELLPHQRTPSSISGVGLPIAPGIHQQHHPSGRKKIKSYFVCCIRA